MPPTATVVALCSKRMDQGSSSLREQGIQALRRGDDDRAMDLLTRAVLADSRDAEARACLGITASRKGFHVRAVSSLREAVALEPDNANYRYNLGVALERAGELREAAEAFAETLRRHPEHSQAAQKLRALGYSEEPPPEQHSEPIAATPEREAPESLPSLSDEAPTPGLSEPVLEPAIEADGAAPEPPPVRTFATPRPLTEAPGTVPGDRLPPAWQQPPPPAAYPTAPYTPPGPYLPPGSRNLYQRPHRGSLILALGIAAIAMLPLCCGGGGLITLALGASAWMMANQDLAAMDQGLMDPNGRRSTESGRVLAILATVLGTLIVLLLIALFIIGVIQGASASAAGTRA